MKNRILLQVIRMSKLALTGVLLQCFFLSLLLAGNGAAQSVKPVSEVTVKISIDDLSLADVFKLIERETSYKFSFYEDLDTEKRITIPAKKQSVSKLLLKISELSNLSFKQVNNVISVKQFKRKIQRQEEIEVIIQTTTVQGKVMSSEDNEPLPGVNVVEKGTSNGTVTDLDGEYNLTVSQGSTLVFSSVGYTTEEVAVGNQSVINLNMSPDIQQLQELVVVGYGTQKKREVIGSVASVSGESLKQVPMPSFDAALQGMASGVQVQNSSGVPGSPTRVLIRGTNSISSGTDPLYIVDGMPIYSDRNGLSNSTSAANQSPLSTINPNDIESIEILKDAAATAIYGSRGSNGVILITTKSGKQGQSRLEANVSTGFSNLSVTPDDIGFTNTTEYFSLMDQARANSGLSPFNPSLVTNLFIDDEVSELSREEAMNVNTDWYNALLRTGGFTDVNFSASNGTEKGSYYISANIRDDKGLIINNSFKRYSLRANLDFKPVENLSVGTRLNFAYTKNLRVPGQGDNSGAGFGAIGLTTLPWWKIYNENDETGYWNPRSGNLVANMDDDLRLDKVDQYRGLGGLFVEYQFPWVEGLSLRGEASADIIQNNSVYWISDVLREDGSYAIDRAVTSNNYNYNLFATFNRVIGDHNFNVVAGTESQEINRYRRQSSGQNLIGRYQQLGSPAERLDMFAGLEGERYLRAYFGRANYSYKEKYMLGVSLRTDGSSAFTENNRWGTFTAFSAGWILSDEDFFKLPVFSLVKLRGSFGQTGNQNIPGNLDITRFRDDRRYGTDDLASGGSSVRSIGNSSLTWETTDSYDLGIDFGLLEDRISGSVAYYSQQVDDLLLEVPVPVSTGLDGSSSIWANAGKLSNSGFEFSLSTINIHNSNFKWSTEINFTTTYNEVKGLNKEVDESGQGIISDITLTRTGGRLGAFFLAEYAGIDRDRGIELIYEIDRDLYLETGQTEKTGRKIPATLANVRDHRIFHENASGLPTYFGGMTNRFEYKGFDLNLFLTFMGGNHIYDYARNRTSYAQRGQRWLRSDLIGNTWTPDNPDAEYPELRWDSGYNFTWDAEDGAIIEGVGNYNNETFFHDRFLQKGDFLRLRNLQVGYTLPATVLNRINMTNIYVFVAGTNLLTFTAYEGWDPEVVRTGGSSQQVNLSQGRVNVPELPQLRTYSLGLNVTF